MSGLMITSQLILCCIKWNDVPFYSYIAFWFLAFYCHASIRTMLFICYVYVCVVLSLFICLFSFHYLLGHFSVQVKGVSVTPSSDQMVVVHLAGGNDLVVCLRSANDDERVGELVGALAFCMLRYGWMYLLASWYWLQAAFLYVYCNISSIPFGRICCGRLPANPCNSEKCESNMVPLVLFQQLILLIRH